MACSVEMDGIRYVTLEKPIEIELASGMTASDRLKDLVDVQELVKAAALPVDLSMRLDPSVRATYEDLWHKAQPAGEKG